MSTNETTETDTTTPTEPKKAPAARKAAASKTTARKAAAKPAAEVVEKVEEPEASSYFSKAKLKESGEKFEAFADKAQSLAWECVLAQLGFYGKVYDGFSSRIESTREQAPKQWGELVERGKQLQSDLLKSQEELKSRFEKSEIVAKIQDTVLAAKIKDFDLQSCTDKARVSCEEAFDKVRGLYKKSA